MGVFNNLLIISALTSVTMGGLFIVLVLRRMPEIVHWKLVLVILVVNALTDLLAVALGYTLVAMVWFAATFFWAVLFIRLISDTRSS